APARRPSLRRCATAGSRHRAGMLGNGWSACAQLCSRLGPRQDAAWYTGRVERPLVFITRRLVLAPQSVLGAGIQIDLHDSEHAGRVRGWAPTMLLGRDLRGRTLGILGYGRIGRAVARRAEGFGMNVLFNARGGGVPFDELLPQADILSVHCPLTPQTRHLMG